MYLAKSAKSARILSQDHKKIVFALVAVVFLCCCCFFCAVGSLKTHGIAPVATERKVSSVFFKQEFVSFFKARARSVEHSSNTGFKFF